MVEEKKSVVGGTSSVEVESRLAASAEDMWLFLTDEKRVPMWTRSPAKVGPRASFSFLSFSTLNLSTDPLCDVALDELDLGTGRFGIRNVRRKYSGKDHLCRTGSETRAVVAIEEPQLAFRSVLRV